MVVLLGATVLGADRAVKAPHPSVIDDGRGRQCDAEPLEPPILLPCDSLSLTSHVCHDLRLAPFVGAW